MSAPQPSPTHPLRNLPSVERFLQEAAAPLVQCFGRFLTLRAVQETLQEARQLYPSAGVIPDQSELLQRCEAKLREWTTPSLFEVINATGVVLHTNLGRAPLSTAALQAIQDVASGYSNLEYDLTKGQRGSRLIHAENLLKRLTGAEAALVVNNNAAAVLLALGCLARRRAVIIARSQLVEIGGGFRVPDVMRQSGARLVEVGTTNRVHLQDYEQAIQETVPALVMVVHRSNFQIIGFTSEPPLEDIVQVAHRSGIPVLHDLGSGALLDTSQYGLAQEPMVSDSLALGADLVCFSGDKLLGGPQAGIILGKAELIERLKKHPLSRAIRADKLCLAALSATLVHYLKGEAEQEIPVWKMISASPGNLQERAQRWQAALGTGAVIAGQSAIGGGSLPGETLPTFVLSLQVRNPNRFLERLRTAEKPVLARLENDQVLFDPRTVLVEQEPMMLHIIQNALSKSRQPAGRSGESSKLEKNDL